MRDIVDFDRYLKDGRAEREALLAIGRRRVPGLRLVLLAELRNADRLCWDGDRTLRMWRWDKCWGLAHEIGHLLVSSDIRMRIPEYGLGPIGVADASSPIPMFSERSLVAEERLANIAGFCCLVVQQVPVRQLRLHFDGVSAFLQLRTFDRMRRVLSPWFTSEELKQLKRAFLRESKSKTKARNESARTARSPSP